MTSHEIKAMLMSCPGAEAYLNRVVKHAASRETLPPRIVLGSITGDKDIESSLSKILSNRCFAENGKYILKLPDRMRNSSYWQPLVEAIGYEKKPDFSLAALNLAKETAKRLKIIHPEEKALIAKLEDSGFIRGYVGTDPDKVSSYLKIFAAYVATGKRESTTLSQLGSDIFNDSKALRGGPLLGQLDKILRIAYDQPDIPVAELHANCGIIENPYTSHVVVFAPFSFDTNDGNTYDYPKRLFGSGLAAVLSWETVQHITTINIDVPLQLVTCENAAPFHGLVHTSTPALYTEGYPNSPVKVLLKHFNRVGARALHFGDTDLDGYRIAEQISRLISFDGLYGCGQVHTLPRKALTDSQHGRLESFIANHPSFRFADQLRDTLTNGWIEQEAFKLNALH